MSTTRRNFLAGAAALAAASKGQAAARGTDHNWNDIRLAVATYSLRKFPRSEAIAIVKDLGVKYVNVKSFHMPYESSKQELMQARKDFEDAGLEIVSGGNISLKGDEADTKFHLEYAKNAGIPIVVCAPLHDNLGVIEKHAKRLGLKIAIHNHGTEDKYYPNAESVISRVKNMDPLMGLCYDIGHASRTGEDIVEGIEMAGDRLHDMHIKDLANLSDKDSQVAVGQGKMPVTAVFKKLKAVNYPGVVGLEYEINAEAPQRGMAESFAYMRGVIDGLAG